LPDYMIQGGVTYALIPDHLGSPRLVVDVATGTIAQRLHYDEFGRTNLDTNPGFQPFGSAGGLYDPQTGLARFGARDYDPEVGRWTAPDPAGFAGGLNLYGYAYQNPVNFLDLEGEVAVSSTILLVWGAIELGLTLWDLYDAGSTFIDPCASAADNLLSGGGLLDGMAAPGGAYGLSAKAGKKTLRKLPRLDSTGKVHGELPRPKDFPDYEVDNLRQLHEELQVSVWERIRKTEELGRHRPHGQRQGAEQDLTLDLERYLSDL
ncbi:MAG: RHS repeat-associated core domain-containing protein, partial [Holophagales bacterium]|nr:RHS repeat-associated core domain-containing protein [Holophagales bacterium]